MDILHVRDFGITPETGADYAQAFTDLFTAVKQRNTPVELVFEAGRYEVHGEHACRKELFMTNSMSLEECGEHPEHRIALALEGIQNLTLTGNGAEIIVHGTLTYLLVAESENITVQDMTFDFKTPSMAELEVLERGPDSVTYRVHDECPYFIQDGILFFKGEDFLYRTTETRSVSVQRKHGERVWRFGNPFEHARRAEDRGNRIVAIQYTAAQMPELLPGDTVQFRYTTRTEAGFLILHSKNVSFNRVNVHYMHGLGIIAQFSENLSFAGLYAAPRTGTERSVAAFADFMHLCMCRGTIAIKDSFFSGAHDDVINIHGVHLKITGCTGNRATVRFMQSETWGFEAFFPGDRVDFINIESLCSQGEAVVQAASMPDPFTMELTFDRDVSALSENAALENLSWMPEAEISGNRFERIPTRGILYSSRGKCVIANNVFHKMHMSAVLIASDAASWYESGMVKDVTIRGNTFTECDQTVILVQPENTRLDQNKPVHTNITIEDNVFLLGDTVALDIKSVRGLLVKNNTIKGSTGGQPLIRLLAVTEAVFQDNQFQADNRDIVARDSEYRLVQ